jgi:CrcB protein
MPAAARAGAARRAKSGTGGRGGMTLLLAVAAGGALGALGRYAVMSAAGTRFGTDFPYGTLIVNVAGSALMGALVAAAAGAPLDAKLAFAGAGLLGGFTTFSTFALDTVHLARRHNSLGAVIYVVVSVALSLGAFAAGFGLVRAALA